MSAPLAIQVRNTLRQDFPQILELCQRVYPQSRPWNQDQLESHLRLFPEGQLVAEEEGGRLVGMAASLIVRWDDYEMQSSWRAFTDSGTFTNHDPERGRTLYGAEVMVDPEARRRRVGSRLYAARRDLARRLGLARIRAGARLRGYHRHRDELRPEAYVRRVVAGEIRDPTLSFQLRQGFHVIAVVENYLLHDPESLGYAAVIEWLNERVARPEDYEHRERWRRGR
ncbi:MAG: GNAT family N-acetyltransferase [Thermoanaerobaculia bacterium]